MLPSWSWELRINKGSLVILFEIWFGWSKIFVSVTKRWRLCFLFRTGNADGIHIRFPVTHFELRLDARQRTVNPASCIFLPSSSSSATFAISPSNPSVMSTCIYLSTTGNFKLKGDMMFCHKPSMRQNIFQLRKNIVQYSENQQRKTQRSTQNHPGSELMTFLHRSFPCKTRGKCSC